MAEDYKVDGGTLSNFIALFLKNFSMKMNGLFVKNIADFVFSLGEFVLSKWINFFQSMSNIIMIL